MTLMVRLAGALFFLYQSPGCLASKAGAANRQQYRAVRRSSAAVLLNGELPHALGMIELPLADAQCLGRHLKQFIIGEKLYALFQ